MDLMSSLAIPTVSLSWNPPPPRPQLSRDALTFTLPQVPGGPGAPLKSGNFPSRTDTRIALSAYHRWGERPGLLRTPATTCVSLLPSNPVSTMVLLLGLPHEKRPPRPQPNSSPFWKALLTFSCHGMAYPDWCYGEEGSGPSFPQGVTWALNGGSWAGLGRERDWTSHSGSETH